ncbi:MAG: response regulator transcription factor [Acidimicrobiia bacterium]|nr:response regulator transcription factor [Acidimicrobiia bacterium]
MADTSKKVTICTPSESFGKALRLLLDDYAVRLTRHPSRGATDSDLVVWEINGAVESQALSEVSSAVSTLILADKSQLIRSVDAGCRGFLPSSASLEEVRRAIDIILDGGAVIPPELLGTLLRHVVQRRRQDAAASDVLDGLTKRERQVFWLAAEGARKEEIGKRMFISPATARTHLQNVYRKLGVHSQSELMALAARIAEFSTEEDA